MERKAVSGIMLTLLLASMSILPFSIGDENKYRWVADSSHQGFDVDGLAERKWSFDRAREWGDFAYVDEDSAELVIGVSDAPLDAYVELSRVIDMNGGQIVNTVSMREAVWAVVADVPFDLIPSFVNNIEAAGLARYVEPNMRFQAQFVPDDPYWSLQWGPQKIEADWAWNTTIGGPLLVAVVDTGVDLDHPDLGPIELGYDWVNNDPDPMDDNGHGTHCAGVIAAMINNGIGIAGLAQVVIIAEKGLDYAGGGYEDDLANAIINATDMGADIISNSWGGYGESALIYDAVKYAYDAGVLIVASAGNDATCEVGYPAKFETVIAVSAVDYNDQPSRFADWNEDGDYDDSSEATNYGPEIELCAPGGGDLNLDGRSDDENEYVYSTLWDDTYGGPGWAGTSMSAPHVSGVAALIWSQFPYMTRDQVRAQLRRTADDLGGPGFDDHHGYGRVNAREAVEQAPPDHDLVIFEWKRSPFFKLGELATFNTTVLNFGISDETDVEVQLLANGSLVDSTSIAFLPWGTSTTVSLSWTPTLEGMCNVTSYVVPVLGETITQDNLFTEIVNVVAPPPETDWTLLATDPDEGVGTNLKAISGQLHSASAWVWRDGMIRLRARIIFFKVEHYRLWTTLNDIDTGILIDADQDPGTGLPDGAYPDQNTGIGADYLIVVGREGTEMWEWDPFAGSWDVCNPISLAYLDAPDGSNVLVVGVYLVDTRLLLASAVGDLDCAVADIESDWDWMPNTGRFTLALPRVRNIDTDLDFMTIQEAIDAPETLDGHTILVYAGTYFESVIIDKSISLVGEDRSTTIIDGYGTDVVVTITANNVYVSGFTIQNATLHDLELTGNFTTLSNNRVLGAITTYYSEAECIVVHDSIGNSITDNIIETQEGPMPVGTGIWLHNTNWTTISRNSVSHFEAAGVLLEFSSDNTISGNTFSSNVGAGIYLFDPESQNNTISGNIVSINDEYGIILAGSSNNTLFGNNVSDNSYGIYLYQSETNNNKIFHNNFINNTVQAYLEDPCNNVWDDGYPSGGNYWSDHVTVDDYSGINQDEPGSDGIVDTPYVIDGNNQDNYPFMNPWIPQARATTVATCTYISGNPTVYNDVIAFSSDLDTAYTLMYYKISTETLTNTSVTDTFFPSVYENTIAFATFTVSPVPWETWIGLYDIPTGTVNMILHPDLGIVDDLSVWNWGRAPAVSIHGNIIGFYDYEGIWYYDIATTTWTQLSASEGGTKFGISVCGDIIAFSEGRAWSQTIRYHDVSTGITIDTGINGVHPTVCQNVIAFEWGNTIFYYDINSGTITSTRAAGKQPWIWSDLIAFSTNGVIRYYSMSSGLVANTGEVGEYPSLWGRAAFVTNELDLGIDVNGDGDFDDWVVRFLTIRTPGDVNDDGTVNVLDLGVLSDHWFPGPPVGQLGYDPVADINCDGEVNILDLGIVSDYWTGPPKGPLDP